MASIDWPTTVPVALVGSIREPRIPAFRNDPADAGAPRRRKVFTRTLRGFAFTIRVTDTQKGYLDTFIDTTTDGGVEIFNWTHPVTSTTYEVRFMELPEPRDFTKGIWDIDITLEQV